jgi:hypothetical protein
VASHLTRKAILKQDKFAVEVEHTVDYFAAHRQQTILYGGIALAIIVIAGGFFYFRNSQHSVREQVLGEALSLANAPVGTAAPTGGPSFPTEAAKDDAVSKALTKVASDYAGTAEGYVAEYSLAGQRLMQAKRTTPEKSIRMSPIMRKLTTRRSQSSRSPRSTPAKIATAMPRNC